MNALFLRLRVNPLRLAFGVWVALAVAAAVRTLLSPIQHSVFPIFAGSAVRWWQDRSLYNLYLPLDVFRYPPVFAVLATPFAALGLRLGGVLWLWVGLGTLLGGLWCFLRDVAPGRWLRWRTALFLILCAIGAARGIWNAQSNALVVGLLLLAASALVRAVNSEAAGDGRARSRWWRAAVLLAAAVCLKLTPLAPALLLCALWPSRLGWRFAIAVAAGFLVPFATKPFAVVMNHYEDWLVHLFGSGGERWAGFRDGWTCWLAVRHVADGLPGQMSLTAPLHSTAYRLVQLLTALGSLGWCLWQKRRAARVGLPASWVVHVTFSLGMAWLMLFGPAIEHATYVFLAAPLAWAIVQREEWPAGRGIILASGTLVFLLGWGVFSRTAILLSPEGGSLLVIALPLGTILFTLWLCGYATACKVQPIAPPFGGPLTSGSFSRPPKGGAGTRLIHEGEFVRQQETLSVARPA
jgi:hypothetical protein